MPYTMPFLSLLQLPFILSIHALIHVPFFFIIMTPLYTLISIYITLIINPIIFHFNDLYIPLLSILNSNCIYISYLLYLFHLIISLSNIIQITSNTLIKTQNNLNSHIISISPLYSEISPQTITYTQSIYIYKYLYQCITCHASLFFTRNSLNFSYTLSDITFIFCSISSIPPTDFSLNILISYSFS